jgi:hypothetical protein
MHEENGIRFSQKKYFPIRNGQFVETAKTDYSLFLLSTAVFDLSNQ